MALCLGPCDITVSEMASAYTAFVNSGLRCAPILVSKIEDSEGNVIAEFTPRMSEVVTEQTSRYIIEMMRAVVDQGTAKRLRFKYNLTGPIAGKTGTTNNNSDGWFVGCVPQLVTACWVGGEDRDIHFNSTSMGQGASTALPIWAYYMTKIYRNKALGYNPNTDFYPSDTETATELSSKDDSSNAQSSPTNHIRTPNERTSVKEKNNGGDNVFR